MQHKPPLSIWRVTAYTLLLIIAIYSIQAEVLFANTTSAERTAEPWGELIADGSVTIKLDENKKSTAGRIRLVRGMVCVTIRGGALTNYMLMNNLSAVTINVEVFRLSPDSILFVFGPSGAYFEPKLELTLKRQYMLPNFMLYDENGEALEFEVRRKKDAITFFIPHFSSYSYDLYDY